MEKRHIWALLIALSILAAIGGVLHQSKASQAEQSVPAENKTMVENVTAVSAPTLSLTTVPVSTSKAPEKIIDWVVTESRSYPPQVGVELTNLVNRNVSVRVDVSGNVAEVFLQANKKRSLQLPLNNVKIESGERILDIRIFADGQLAANTSRKMSFGSSGSSSGGSAKHAVSVTPAPTSTPAPVKLPKVEFSISNATGQKGKNVNISMNIVNRLPAGSITAVTFEVGYNQSVMDLVSVEKGSLISGWDKPGFSHANGKVSIFYPGIGTGIASGSAGSVALFNFSVIGGAGTQSNVTISNVKVGIISGDVAEVTAITNGSFTAG